MNEEKTERLVLGSIYDIDELRSGYLTASHSFFSIIIIVVIIPVIINAFCLTLATAVVPIGQCRSPSSNERNDLLCILLCVSMCVLCVVNLFCFGLVMMSMMLMMLTMMMITIISSACAQRQLSLMHYCERRMGTILYVMPST